MWLMTPLQTGPNKIQGELIVQADHVASAWVVGHESVPWQQLSKLDVRRLPSPEDRFRSSIPVFGQAALEDGLPLETGEGPVERIEGVFLDTLDPVSATQGWGTLRRNQSVWEKPLTIAGQRHRRGIGTHAPSRIVYRLDGRYSRFRACAGPDQATAPTITMEVWVDGRLVWQSGPLTRTSPAQEVDLDIRQAQELELRVGDGGNGLMADHANWADAVLLR